MTAERRRPAERSWERAAAIWVLLVCGAVYAARGCYEEERQLRSYDFKTVYGSARCLLRGCDPYDSRQILAAFVEAGGPGDDLRPFRPHEPVYLPSALALVAPFALLRWGPARISCGWPRAWRCSCWARG